MEVEDEEDEQIPAWANETFGEKTLPSSNLASKRTLLMEVNFAALSEWLCQSSVTYFLIFILRLI